MRLQDIQMKLGQNRVRLVRLQRQTARLLREIAARREELGNDDEYTLAEQAI